MPFMNRTTGAVSRTPSIVFFVSSERRRSCWNWNRWRGGGVRRRRVVFCRVIPAFQLVFLFTKQFGLWVNTCLSTGNLENRDAMVMMFVEFQIMKCARRIVEMRLLLGNQ